MIELKKLQSAQLCSNTVGQIVVDCITNPPKPGDESYELFMHVCLHLYETTYNLAFIFLCEKSVGTTELHYI